MLYAEHKRLCLADGVKPAPKVRPRGGYHAINASKSISKQYAELKALRQKGIIRESPRVMLVDSRGKNDSMGN